MRCIAMRTLLLGVVSTWGLVAGRAVAGELPPEAGKLVAAFEEDFDALQSEAERKIELRRRRAAKDLKAVQDEYTRAAKLDEAVAIRDERRELTGDGRGRTSADDTEADLPEEAVRLLTALEEDVEALRREAAREIHARRRELIGDLQPIQDRFTRAAKLDEAVAVRDTIRELKKGVSNVQPDPWHVMNYQNDVGRTLYFEVTGVAPGKVYGTDVYTGDSQIAACAVHAGVLKNGETGIVKVRILPGRANYPSSTRNGVTSSRWGSYSLSFEVDDVLGVPGIDLPVADPEDPVPEDATPPEGDES